MNPIHLAAGEGRSLNILGYTNLIRLSGLDTGGVLSVVETADKLGEGPPPHIHHRETETFHVLEGEYEFTCGSKKFLAKKGATIFGPLGVPHGFRCVSPDGGRISVTLTPAGFEEFFEEVGALSAAEQQIPRVMEIGKKYGLEFLPPPTA